MSQMVPTAGGGALKKVIGTAIVIALLVIVVRHPVDAANWVTAGFDLAQGLVDGFVTFFRAVGS